MALTALASSSYPGLPHAFPWEYPGLQASEQYQLNVRTGLRWLLHQGDVPFRETRQPRHWQVSASRVIWSAICVHEEVRNDAMVEVTGFK